MMVQWKPLIKDIYSHKVDFLLSQCYKPSFREVILHTKQDMEKWAIGKVMITDEIKGANLPRFLFL